MTTAQFLDASYALICEDIARANPFAEIPTVKDLFTPKQKPVQAESPASRAASNQQQMEILTAMMGGVQNAPTGVSKTRRQPGRGRR